MSDTQQVFGPKPPAPLHFSHVEKTTNAAGQPVTRGWYACDVANGAAVARPQRSSSAVEFTIPPPPKKPVWPVVIAGGGCGCFSLIGVGLSFAAWAFFAGFFDAAARTSVKVEPINAPSITFGASNSRTDQCRKLLISWLNGEQRFSLTPAELAAARGAVEADK